VFIDDYGIVRDYGIVCDEPVSGLLLLNGFRRRSLYFLMDVRIPASHGL